MQGRSFLGNRVLTGWVLACGMLFAGPAPEDPKGSPLPPVEAVNQTLPSWLRIGGEDRLRFENLDNVGYTSVTDGYLLQRLRLNVDLKPASWIRFSFQGQDSRVFGQNTLPAPNTQKDQMDLRIGYVELGSESGHVALRIGRQLLQFGEQRLFGDPDWSNVGRSFDAARLTLRSSWGRADLFTAAYVKVDQLSFSEPTPGQHLDGAYGALTKIVPGASIEPYLFWRMEHNQKSELGHLGNVDEKTLGVRFAGKVPGNVDYSIEAAHQTGTWVTDPISAWAAHWLLGYTLPAPMQRLRVYGEFNQASGDSAPKDGRWGTFDLLFPAGHDKLGFDDLFGWSNIRHFRGGGEYKFRPSLSLILALNNYWLNSPTDSLYSSSGKSIARSTAGTAGTFVGTEIDAQARWVVRRGTIAHLGVGRLVPGEFLKHTTTGLPYTLFTISLTQQF